MFILNKAVKHGHDMLFHPRSPTPCIYRFRLSCKLFRLSEVIALVSLSTTFFLFIHTRALNVKLAEVTIFNLYIKELIHRVIFKNLKEKITLLKI